METLVHKMMDKMIGPSWRTSLLGIIAGAMILLPQIQALLDNNPDTVVNSEMVMAGLAVWGIGRAARDNPVTSEAARAKKVN